ncbi:MAG: histidine kinase [Kordiimonadaceae bacterium]|nr:histidine kinase [Kordiimonadaceae bacterium]MBO6568553.1 histidine kinase [Kordiimonadaceae bacterium]MBO6963718.1 histidine kinase [Kordiimonadaceae bacterium]
MKILHSNIHAFWLWATLSLVAALPTLAQPVTIDGGAPEQLHSTEVDYIGAASSKEWQPFTGQLQTDDDTFWVRQTLNLEWGPAGPTNNPLALTFQVTGLYHVYWDGTLLGSNAYLGDKATEFSRVMVPIELAHSGNHELYVRLHARGLKAGSRATIGVFTTDLAADFFGIHFTVVFVFLLTVTCYLASAYFATVSRQGNLQNLCRMAALTTFIAGSLVFLDRARFLTPYPYTWQASVDVIMASLTIGFVVAIAGYCALRLELKRPLLWTTASIATIFAGLLPLGSMDEDTRILVFLGLYILFMAVVSWRAEVSVAKWVVGAVVLALLALGIQPDEKTLFLGILTVLFGAELALDIRRRHMQAQQLALLSARLRGDLLRQNIKPHFLMNSLTALMEWIETNPPEAVKFVEGLAREFRLLTDFSDKQQVTLREELDLCQVHLDLMSQRLGSTLKLVCIDLDLDTLVPPAVFHTLVENAFSHNDYRNGSFEFSFSQETIGDSQCFTLVVPEAGAPAARQGSGLGSDYVRNRLKEFCGNAFRFSTEKIGSNWVSKIELGKS